MSSTGNKFPATGASVDRASATAWTTPGNVVSDNATDTTAAVPTDYLVCSNFTLDVPTGATILGVIVRVEASETGTGSSNYIPQLISDTTPTLIGAAKSAVTVSGTTKVISTNGSATDLWSATLDPATVNAAGFGVAIWSTDTTNTLAIDFVTINVHFTSEIISAGQATGIVDARSEAAVPLSSTAEATAVAEGASTTTAAAESAGISIVDAVGSPQSADGESVGVSTAIAAGHLIAQKSDAVAVGASEAAVAAFSEGIGIGVVVGQEGAGSESADASSVGLAEAIAEGSSQVTAEIAAVGIADGVAEGAAQQTADATSTAMATAEAEGAVLAYANGSATASASAAATGTSTGGAPAISNIITLGARHRQRLLREDEEILAAVVALLPDLIGVELEDAPQPRPRKAA